MMESSNFKFGNDRVYRGWTSAAVGCCARRIESGSAIGTRKYRVNLFPANP